MMRHGECVEGPQPRQRPARLGEPRDIARQRRRIAGHVGEPLGRPLGHVRDYLARQACPRRIGDHEPGGRNLTVAHRRRHVRAVNPRPPELAKIVPCVPDRRRIGLHAHHAPPGPHHWRDHPREQPRTAVQIHRAVARLGRQDFQHGPRQHIRRARVHLPERPYAHPPVPPSRPLAHIRTSAHRRQPPPPPDEHGDFTTVAGPIGPLYRGRWRQRGGRRPDSRRARSPSAVP
jgi:hypothetical protein